MPKVKMMQGFAGVEVRLMKKAYGGAAQFEMIIVRTLVNQLQELLLAGRDRINEAIPNGLMSGGYKANVQNAASRCQYVMLMQAKPLCSVEKHDSRFQQQQKRPVPGQPTNMATTAPVQHLPFTRKGCVF
jgi:hypothetical protein